MKFQLKALVAAVAAVAASSSAFAAIDSTTNGVVASTTNTGGSELVFVVWDSVAKKSYTKDLGIVASDFNLNSTQNFGSIADAAWTSYVSAVGGSFTNSKFGVVAFRQGDNFTDNETWALSTLRASKSFASQGTGNLKGVNTAFSAFITDANSESHAGAGNFSDFSAFGDGNSYWGTQEGSKLQAKLVAEFDNTIGTSASFWKLSAAADNLQAPTLTQYGNWDFTLAGTTGNLIYTAVPEPETYGLLASGLLLMGAVARRRRAA